MKSYLNVMIVKKKNAFSYIYKMTSRDISYLRFLFQLPLIDLSPLLFRAAKAITIITASRCFDE